MKLNEEEIDALVAYFDETNINITSCYIIMFKM